MNLDQSIEAVLFASARPHTIKRLVELFGATREQVEAAVEALHARLEHSAIMIQRNLDQVELVTRPEAAEIVSAVIGAEAKGELSRASLETLTILAYRGPLTRPELEQIRGVQSSMILRNLLLRGLIEQQEDARLGQPVYSITFAFLNHLGLSRVEDLPDYEALRGHHAIADVLATLENVPVQTKIPLTDSDLPPAKGDRGGQDASAEVSDTSEPLQSL